MDHQELKALFEEHLRPWTGLLTGYIRMGQEAGSVRSDLDPDLHRLSLLARHGEGRPHARETLAGNASLIVNMVPIGMPFLLWILAKEHLHRLEWIATVIAIRAMNRLSPRCSRASRTTEASWCVAM